MTILLLAHNEKEYVIKAMEHLKNLIKDGAKLSVILIDNSSKDGLITWVQEQKNINYMNIYMMKPWSNIIKHALKNYDIDDHVLIMKPNFFPSKECLDKLSNILDEDDNCAMVSPVCNGLNYSYNYNGKIVKAIKPTDIFLLIKKKIFNQVKIIDDIWNVAAFNLSLVIQITKMGYSYKKLNSPILKDPYNYHEDPDILSYENIDKKILENEFGIHYFSGTNYFITKLVDEEDHNKPIKVFEVGCDSGATLLHIKEEYPNSIIIGCDINPNIIEIASNCLDKAFVADIENDNIPIEPESLDYVIFGDVLEHLRNPERALKIAHILLKPDGKVIASIPNTMNIFVMKQLLAGNFTYADYGLLDKTHIHLFTLNEIHKLFINTNYTPEIIMYNQQNISDEDNKLIDKLMEISSKDITRYMYTAYQYQIRAVKTETL